ncbi:MAG: hypothetical protein MUF64_21475 [Polyangiaceae bacterium]|jgi:hypothetical protein|nr:hypothetical protein [Polyangiaceae bacterium]
MGKTRVDLALLLPPWALLLWHARRFDFLCDDAFIALRYARSWAETGAPVYNPGERVEGFTSFLFMGLVAGLTRLGLTPPGAATVLGVASSLLFLGASLSLLRAALGRRSPVTELTFLSLLALSAPVAAWSLGGLETPLFAALSALGLALSIHEPSSVGKFHTLRRDPRAVAAGLVLGAATLARPEGGLFLAGAVVAGALAWRGPGGWRRPGALGLGYAAVMVPFEGWRWWYYGAPLPNTFYVKSTGDAGALWARGVEYGELALRELNPALVALGALGLAAPGGGAGLWALRLIVPVGALYVLRIGGDFLDLYRFFVPLWPLVLVGVVRCQDALRGRLAAKVGDARAAVFVLALGAGAAVGHGWHQHQVGRRAMQVAEPERAARHIEPLGWTREYALRWAAVGRWMAEVARPGDTMAVGAAGAMPYFARMPSLDLFGLCDAYIARHGVQIGTRPGHQRYAPRWYILERQPTFLVLEPEAVGPGSSALGVDPVWNPQGWVWAELRTDPSRHGHVRPLSLRFLLRRDRAMTLAGAPGLRIAEDNPR